MAADAAAAEVKVEAGIFLISVKRGEIESISLRLYTNFKHGNL